MKKRNQQIAKISVFITSLFVICLSVTYAFINLTIGGEKRQVITAGSLELELIEDENNLTITNALPMYDEVGMIQDAFTFRLHNKGTTSVNYKVKLVDITTGEKLPLEDVRYGLVKNGKSKISSLSSLRDNVIDKGKIDGGQRIEYELRLWLREGIEDNSIVYGKSLSFKLEVEIEQEIEKPVYAMMIKRNSSTSTELFWKYSNQITSVIFENKILIPESIADDKKWDVSENQDGSVMAYIEENGTIGTTTTVAYRLHIQGNEGIAANFNSSYLFANFRYLQSIEGMEYFDTSNVTDMYSMFNGCAALTSLDLSNFDTSQVTNMNSMFKGCRGLTSLDLSNFDTSNVIGMPDMFNGCRGLTSLDLSNFDTSQVRTMLSMFYNCVSLVSLDLSNFDTSQVTNMHSMFTNCRALTSLDLSSFDTSNVMSMQAMFSDCSSLTSLYVSSFNTSNVTNMSSMFAGCRDLTSLDLSTFDMSKLKYSNSMLLNLKSDVLITVKDEDTKAQILNINGDLTNVVVKIA